MTLFTKAESTEEELGMDIKVEASCLCFVLNSHSIFLVGHLAEAFLGGIWGFEKKSTRVPLGFDNFEGIFEGFWRISKGFGEAYEVSTYGDF